MPWKRHKYEFETVGIKKLLTDKPARVLFSSVSFCESNTNHVFFSSVGSKFNRRTGIRITYYFCLNSVSQHSSPGSRKPSREFFLSKIKFEKHNNEKKKKKSEENMSRKFQNQTSLSILVLAHKCIFLQLCIDKALMVVVFGLPSQIDVVALDHRKIILFWRLIHSENKHVHRNIGQLSIDCW